jgi:hypothetical protein
MRHDDERSHMSDENVADDTFLGVPVEAVAESLSGLPNLQDRAARVKLLADLMVETALLFGKVLRIEPDTITVAITFKSGDPCAFIANEEMGERIRSGETDAQEIAAITADNLFMHATGIVKHVFGQKISVNLPVAMRRFTAKRGGVAAGRQRHSVAVARGRRMPKR